MARLRLASAFAMALVAATSATVAFAWSCTAPPAKLSIPVLAPSGSGVGGPRVWNMSLCAPSPVQCDPTGNLVFVAELPADGSDRCLHRFVEQQNAWWTPVVGGWHTVFTTDPSIGPATSLNLTLRCASDYATPKAMGDVTAVQAVDGSWTYSMILAAAAGCGGAAPPPPAQGKAAFLECTDTQCEYCAPVVFDTQVCTSSSDWSSRMYHCLADGSGVSLMRFNQSSTCESGTPSTVEMFPFDQCVASKDPTNPIRSQSSDWCT